LPCRGHPCHCIWRLFPLVLQLEYLRITGEFVTIRTKTNVPNQLSFFSRTSATWDDGFV
jgi:hypothetical protein